MTSAARDHYEAHPDPAPDTVAIGPSQLDRLDDGLHFGWSWYRYQFCYRDWHNLRVLDAGCGTGLTTLGLAKLNPGSHVLGIDVSPRSLALAQERASVQAGLDVAFREHDLNERLPDDVGPFDFIVCRGVLHQVADPVQLLRDLANRLETRGLLLATFASEAGQSPVRQMRSAVDALVTPEMSLEDRAHVGIELFRALRADHPIRQYEFAAQGNALPGIERMIAGYLTIPMHGWSLASAIGAVEDAGLQYLYVAQRLPWLADRVFNKTEVSPGLQARVESRSERARSVLIDALDPAIHGGEYRIYACLPEYEPRVPGWPEQVESRPETFDKLIPHRTGLAWPAEASSTAPTGQARATYRLIGGGVGQLDWLSDALFRGVDDKTTCGEINQRLRPPPGMQDDASLRCSRWLDLAHNGLLVLESPDARQYRDCQHLGRIVDRLDCACPRRWVRACERHEFCTIDDVAQTDERYPALVLATTRLQRTQVTSCQVCPDYSPVD